MCKFGSKVMLVVSNDEVNMSIVDIERGAIFICLLLWQSQAQTAHRHISLTSHSVDCVLPLSTRKSDWSEWSSNDLELPVGPLCPRCSSQLSF